jgi:predicted amidohydrolase
VLPPGSFDAIALVRERVRACEAAGVSILCCPEALLGGLADDAPRPAEIALRRDGIEAVLAPLASDSVATIVGFTEIDASGRLFNAAAILERGTVVGIYRKRHPAIRRSVYAAGDDLPVFRVGALTFGILLCYDSTFSENARALSERGATAIFIPSNNALPPAKADVLAATRACDVSIARENRVAVIRADVAGRFGNRESHGSSAIVGPDGQVHCEGRRFEADLLITEIAAERPLTSAGRARGNAGPR